MILNDDDNTEDNDMKDEATEIEQNNVLKHVDDPGDDIDESINMPLISLTEKDKILIQTTGLIEKMNINLNNRTYCWRKHDASRNYQHFNVKFLNPPDKPQTPLQYFKAYFTEYLFLFKIPISIIYKNLEILLKQIKIK